MMTVEEVKSLVQSVFPVAEIHVSDMTGTMDHFQIVVVSPEFEGKLLVKQHQMVQKSVSAALADGRIHAIAIKTFTPGQWKKENHLFNLGS